MVVLERTDQSPSQGLCRPVCTPILGVLQGWPKVTLQLLQAGGVTCCRGKVQTREISCLCAFIPEIEFRCGGGGPVTVAVFVPRVMFCNFICVSYFQIKESVYAGDKNRRR